MANVNISSNWTFIKALVDAGTKLHYTEDAVQYRLMTFNGQILYETHLFKDSSSVILEDATQNDLDLTDFEDNYKPTANPIEKVSVEATLVSGSEINIKGGSPCTSTKLRYDQMTRNQTVANGSYTEVYNYSGTGKVSAIYLKFSFKTMQIKVTVDGEDIFADLDIEDLPKGNGANENTTPFIWRSALNEVVVQFPHSISYDTSVSIYAKGSMNDKKLSWGYVVLTKET